MAPPPTTMDDAARTDRDEGERGKGGEGASAGALLRAAREKQGLHIAALAAAIKVTPRKLEALEHDRWDELPGPTFTRALAQAVCRALRADPAPVMELLPPADTSMLDSSFGTMNEPFAGKGGREPGWIGWLPRGPSKWAAVRPVVVATSVNVTRGTSSGNVRPSESVIPSTLSPGRYGRACSRDHRMPPTASAMNAALPANVNTTRRVRRDIGCPIALTWPTRTAGRSARWPRPTRCP